MAPISPSRALKYLFRITPAKGQGIITQTKLFWLRRVTAPGRILILILILAGTIASTVGINVPLYYFACFLFSLFLVARLMGLAFRPKVLISRTLPERAAAGAEVIIHAELKNTGHLPALDLAVTESRPPEGIDLPESPEYHAYLGSGESAQLTYRIYPKYRGVYDFSGPLAISAFPFGIFHSVHGQTDPHRMLIYPRFVPIDSIDLPVGRKHQPGGLQLVSSVGDSPEFIGNREYRPGDRLRDIHHTAWARVGFPVVREYQQEYLCRVALVVDTFIGMDLRHRLESGIASFLDMRNLKLDGKSAKAHADLEAGISLAAGVADALSRQEYVIDLFAAGPELYHFQAGRSLAYLDNILDILACIEPCPSNPFTRLGPALQEEISQISTMLIILLDWDEDRENFVRSIRDCGVAVKVMVVRTGDTSRPAEGFKSEAGPVINLTPREIELGVNRL